MNVDQVMAEMSSAHHAGATLVSNEGDGVVGYAVGDLSLIPGSNVVLDPNRRTPQRSPRLTTGDSPDSGFRMYLSNRLASPPPPPPGQLPNTSQQPFDHEQTMSLGVALDVGVSSILLKLTFFAWGGGTFRLVMAKHGDLLAGLGPSLGSSSEALYVLSFTQVRKSPS